MNLDYPNPQHGSMGWKAIDLVNGKADLIIQLSLEQQSDLRKAAQEIVASGQPLSNSIHQVQSMDALSETLRRAAHEVDSGRGIVILQGFPLAESSTAESTRPLHTSVILETETSASKLHGLKLDCES